MPRPKKTTEEGEASGAEVTKIIFKLRGRDIKERVFDAENHGENFAEVADEFEESNKALIIERIEE